MPQATQAAINVATTYRNEAQNLQDMYAGWLTSKGRQPANDGAYKALGQAIWAMDGALVPPVDQIALQDASNGLLRQVKRVQGILKAAGLLP